jgi:hypothetical protein
MDDTYKKCESLEGYIHGSLLEGTTALCITTLSIKGLYVKLSISDSQCNNACHYAECRELLIVMLNVVTLSVVMLIVLEHKIYPILYNGLNLKKT